MIDHKYQTFISMYGQTINLIKKKNNKQLISATKICLKGNITIPLQ